PDLCPASLHDALPISSTSGVMLMAACIRAGSPSRIGRTFLFSLRRLDFIHFGVKPLELRYLEQAVDELGRSPIHFDMESLKLARARKSTRLNSSHVSI